MSAPGIIIRESGASSLSVMASPTAVPVFVGHFASAEASASVDEKCIRVDSWLDFSQRFVGSVASVTFTTTSPQHEATLAQETEAPSEATSVSVFEGETARFDFTFSEPVADAKKLWLKLDKADSGYGRQPAKLVCHPKGETFWLDFKTDTPKEIILSVELPLGSTTATLYLDTLFDKDAARGTFSLHASVADTEPETYTDTVSASIKAVVGNVKPDTRLHHSYFAVQHYFQNGGGPCYVLLLTTKDDSELATLPSIIQEQAPDATLLLCAETDTTPAGIELKAKVYTELDSLLRTQPSCFLIADSADGTVKPSTTPEQTATYYPSLQTRFSSRPADEAITLSGYTDVAGNNVATLAALKLINPGAHGYVVEQIQSALGDEFVTLPPPPPSPACIALRTVSAACGRHRPIWRCAGYPG
ncbi:hypothetical protein LZV00_11160 [Pseudomonas kielensis]|uniref:hypothetical protein n=1 Tax=Pseudomonas kielensis TaxID=2762577 RepID=UPI00223F03E3|nr:hypothetical protein [Pseudomonas kielensis]UZM16224.1 hypothetical protein LZV00_11160 [Pseudomonas kielensis]